MHTYTDDETHASLVPTFPDLTGWSLNNLLGQYADDAQRWHEAAQADAPELSQIEADMAAVFNEIERRSSAHETLRETTRREAPAVAARLDAGDLAGAADEFLTWLEARR